MSVCWSRAAGWRRQGNVLHRLHDVGNVGGIVVGVVLVPVFDGAQKVDELDLIELELFYQVVLHEQVPTENLQRQPIGLLLQIKDIKLPLVGPVEACTEPVKLGRPLPYVD